MSTVHFKANARIKDVVGRELINDDSIAIAELVKNSIDAKAKRIDVNFEGAVDGSFGPGGGARIIILDNGEGMNTDDILNKWLNIAYSEKRGKILAGDKGIGRFSCDRLGEILYLRSGKGGSFLSLDIDWRRFEVDDKDKEIGKIPLILNENISQDEFQKGKSVMGVHNLSRGVVLEIIQLRSKWDKKKIRLLRRLLEKMVNPHDSMLEERKFTIRVNASEIDKKLTGPIENKIFSKLAFSATTIESRVDSDSGQIETELRDQGRMVAKVTVKSDPAPYPALAGTRISLHYMNRYKKAMFKRMTATSTLDFGSVFLFLNGFRVLPYGERGDDWLSLDNRKTQGMRRFLGARDLLGRIEIQDPNRDHFRVMSSREGLVDNSAYRQLVDVDRSGNQASYGGYFYDVLGRLEAYVVEGLAWDSLEAGIRDEEIEDMINEGKEERYKLGQGEKDHHILGALHKIVAPPARGKISAVEIDPLLLPKLREEEQGRAKKIIKRLGKLSNMGVLAVDQAQALSEMEKHIESQDVRIQAAEERAKQAEINTAVERTKWMFLKDQVTPELKGVWAMSHELTTKANALKDNLESLGTMLGDNISAEAKNHLSWIRRCAEEIHALSDHIFNRNFQNAHKRAVHDVPEFLRGYKHRHGQDKSIAKIDVLHMGEGELAADFSPMDMTVLLDNLLDNTRKAAKRLKGSHKAIIQMKAFASADDQEVILQFSDDAGGLDDSVTNLDSVFELGFTTTGGMGLGLYNIRKIVEEEMRGTIKCIQKEDKGGVMFEIRFPKK